MGLFNWQEIRGLQQPLADLRTSPDNTVWQACLLAIVAGYADAVGFLAFNAFAGAMTGNTVLLGIALAADNLFDAAQSAGIIAAFVVGVAASAVLRRYVPLAALLGIEAAAIVAAALVAPLVAAPILAFAMGVQNAAMTHFAGTTLNTVVLTGNLQKLVETLLKRDAAVAGDVGGHRRRPAQPVVAGLSRRRGAGSRGLELDSVPALVRAPAARGGAAAQSGLAPRWLNAKWAPTFHRSWRCTGSPAGQASAMILRSCSVTPTPT